jgi:uncharacterized membrane protein
MAMLNSSRSRKLVIGLMFAMMSARLLVFGLAAAGLITWGGSWLDMSWIMPFGMAIVVILFVVLRGPRRIMRQYMGLAAADATPLDVLQKRFARGEITQGQYEQMKQVLQQDAPAASTGDDDPQRLPPAAGPEDGRHRP